MDCDLEKRGEWFVCRRPGCGRRAGRPVHMMCRAASQNRPAEECLRLQTICAACPSHGSVPCEDCGRTVTYPMCGLDLPVANRAKQADAGTCVSRFLRDTYQKRLLAQGGECNQWVLAMAGET